MAINFNVGDFIIPNQAYIQGSLKFDTNTPTLQQTLTSLGHIKDVPCEVAATGSVGSPAVSFIRVVPTDTDNIAYKGGTGISIFFRTDTLLNNSFELSTAFIPGDVLIRCLNNTGSTITKNSIVRQTGFDSTLQVAIIGLADATTETNAVVLGVAQEDIVTSTQGAVLVEGSYQTNTTGFSLNGKVFLSNTPGSIATSAGTVNAVIGKVLSVSSTGAIVLDPDIGLASGGGAASGWTTSSGKVQLTTITDGVEIGTTSMATANKFQVDGDATRHTIEFFPGTGGSFQVEGGPSLLKDGLLVGQSVSLAASDAMIVGGSSARKNVTFTLRSGPNPGDSGGAFAVTGGTGDGAGAGGAVTITGGQGGATGIGGAVTITGGAGGATSGSANAVTIQGGLPTDGNGGGVTISGRTGVGTNRSGGTVTITGGGGTGTVAGANVNITAGSNSGGSGGGGSISITAGSAGGDTGNGGNITIFAGQTGNESAGAGNGGSITISAEEGGVTSGNGGDVTIDAGAASGGNGNGGSVILQPGDENGSGIKGSVKVNLGRFETYKGNDVASATTVTLGAGNYFVITGTTTIDGIVTSGWQAGSVIYLEFTASLTVTHSSGAPGTGAVALLLAGAANFSATAGDTLTLGYNGTNWRELARTVI